MAVLLAEGGGFDIIASRKISKDNPSRSKFVD